MLTSANLKEMSGDSRNMYNHVKRLIDLTLSVIALPFVLITTVIVAIAIKLNDNGPVFYFADRIGYRGKIFQMMKFRSMKVDAPDLRYKDGSTYNAVDDPRVTAIGKVLRRTSLDEIPQLFNILAGQMSLIGPRPDSAFYLSHYTEEERVILNVRPGITGYNQVVSRNSVGTKGKIQNDIYYVEHLSFRLDLYILLTTIKNVIGSKNIYRENGDTTAAEKAEVFHTKDSEGFVTTPTNNEAIGK